MTPPRQLHQKTTRLFSAVLVVLGVAIIVRTVAGGGGALSYGLLLGVLFIAAGVARLWLATRGPGR
jgi:uncharacterized membrane protein HdeD (DUF308 family)